MGDIGILSVRNIFQSQIQINNFKNTYRYYDSFLNNSNSFLHSYTLQYQKCYFILSVRYLTKTNDQSTQLYFIRMTLHVLGHSNRHQMYIDLKFVGKYDYVAANSILVGYHKFTKNFILFLALHSLVDLSLFHKCPLLFLVLRLTSPIPYTCKLLIMLCCLCCSIWLPISEGSQDTYFLGVRLAASCPTPNLEDQFIPFCLGHHLDLSGMGGPTSSYATASIALRIIRPPLHQSKGTFGRGGRILNYKII
jgi:hypothetical protein